MENEAEITEEKQIQTVPDEYLMFFQADRAATLSG